jgi:hypothetical protein
MSCIPLNIHKSKLVTKLHSSKVGNKYNCLHVYTNLDSTSYENNFLKGNTTQGHNITRCFNLSQIA